MDREQARELLSDYLEGQLQAGQRAELEQLLSRDQQLREELERLRDTLSSLSGLRFTPPPAGFAKKVESRIKRRSRGRFFAQQPLLVRLPFEWFSFVIIIVLMMLYITFVLEARQVTPQAGQHATPTAPGSSPAPDASTESSPPRP